MQTGRDKSAIWPYGVAGAVLLFGVVAAAYVGDEEGGDAIIVLGSLAAVVGAMLGAFAGVLVNARRRRL